MKKSGFRIFLSMGFLGFSILMLTGCMGYFEFVNRSTQPGKLATQTMTRYQSASYDVLGVVTAKGESKCVLGVLIEGEEGEGLLWRAAKGEFGDRVTAIKDINVSYEYQSILPPVFSEITTTYVGTAIHEK